MINDPNMAETRVQNWDRFGSYRVIEELGRGKMGVVYKVFGPQGQTWALKTLLKNAPQELLERFKREMSILANIKVANIPQVYDLGQEQGIPYFVMDYLEGISLKEYLQKKGKLREREALQIIGKVSTIIAKTHNHGIIHRDLNPSNIILVDKTPYITDFGLAASHKLTSITKTGTFLGTPNYTPPEQADGKKNQIGPWSDVYALGATLHHLLTGVLPFDGQSHMEIVLNSATKKLAPASKINPKVSKETDLVIQKALSKKIANRYQTAKEFGADLNNILRGREISISTPKAKVFETKQIPLIVFSLAIWLLLALVFFFSGEKKKPIKPKKISKKSLSKKSLSKKSFSKKSSYSNNIIPVQRKPNSPIFSKKVKTFSQRSPNNPQKKHNWIVPKKFDPYGSAHWQPKKGFWVGICKQHFGLLKITDFAQWQNYVLCFDVRVNRGAIGVFVRGFASSAQFPGFLAQLRIPNRIGRWFKVRAKAQGNKLTVVVQGINRPLVRYDNPQIRRNWPQGVMGFGISAGTLVHIRNIKVRKLSNR